MKDPGGGFVSHGGQNTTDRGEVQEAVRGSVGLRCCQVRSRPLLGASARRELVRLVPDATSPRRSHY